MRRFSSDENARVPFAMVAVIILMLSVQSMAYLGGIQRQQAGGNLVKAELSRQNSIMRLAEEKMAQEGFYIASSSIIVSTGLLRNQSMIDKVFRENYSAYMERTFPLTIDPYLIEVRDFSSAVFLEELNSQDLMPSGEVAVSAVRIPGNESTHGAASIPDTVTPQCMGESSVLARYVVVGSGNCTVTNTQSGSSMESPISFKRSLDTPFPIMDSKLQELDMARNNNAMGLARTVKYILTTVAQFRVLEGYGSGLDLAPGTTSDILTDDDIGLAVNIAVLLETVRLFRDYDQDTLRQLDTMYPGQGDEGLSSLFADYLNNGTLDPTDIIAIYAGMGDRELPLDMILAQAFNAVADQFVLKYLDYFGVMDITNAVYRTAQKLGALVEEAERTLSEFILGHDGENRGEARQVSDWIRSHSSRCSWPPDSVDLPGVLPGKEPAGATDLGVLDILQPVEDEFHYMANVTRLLQSASSPVYDYDGAEIGLQFHADLMSENVSAMTMRSSDADGLGYLADFLPADMLRQTPEMEGLWGDFYRDYYSGQQDLVYETVRDAVRNVSMEISGIMVSFIGQKTLSLSGYDGGIYRIDPKDRVSVLEGVEHMISQAIADATDHLRANPGGVEDMLSVLTDRQARLTLRFMEFVWQNYDTIKDRDASLDQAFLSLSHSMLLNATICVHGSSGHSANYTLYNPLGHSRGFADDPLPYNCTESPDTGMYASILSEQNRASMRSDISLQTEEAYERLKEAEVGLHYFGSPDNGLFIKALEETVNGLSGSVFLRFTGQDADGLVGMAGGMVTGMLEGIIWSGDVANTQYTPELVFSSPGGRMPFEMYEGPYETAADADNVWKVSFNVTQDHGALSTIPYIQGMDCAALPGGLLAVGISGPIGIHYTDITSTSDRPFENLWSVAIAGNVNLSVASSSMPFVGNGTHAPAILERNIFLDLDIPVLAYSGWDLSGVDYVSTNDLAGDAEGLLDMIAGFLGRVWDSIVGPVSWMIDQVMAAMGFLADIVGTLLGYATDIMSLVTDTMGMLVEELQNHIRNAINDLMDSAMDWIFALLPDGSSFTFLMFGMPFLVTFGSRNEIQNASNGMGGLLLKVGTCGTLMGAGYQVGLELHALSADAAQAADTDFDLLLLSTVVTDDFTLNTTVDPFMVVQPHLVECRGHGDGWGLELQIPVVEAYDSVSYSLHDIPGVGMALSNIPIPFLGLMASVNAGLEILYTLRGVEAESVVINEVELNPRGRTAGNQWVELHNPTDREIGMGGWVLGSSTSAGFNRSLGASAYLGPGEYMMVRYENATLPTDGIRFELLDLAGHAVDSTPLLSETDNGFADGRFVGPSGSQMTWQRCPNAANLSLAGRWAFNNASMGAENAGMDLDLKEVIWNLIKGAFTATWQDLKDQLALSLDFIVKLVTRFIQRFIDDALRVVERSVVEASLFLDIMLTDMSGSGGGGMTLSFVIEGGETLASILRWIIGSISAYLSQFGKPNQPAQYPQLPAHVPEHLFVRLDMYGIVQVPQMVKSAARAGEDIEQVKLAYRIEPNIPALAALTGRDMGQWRINFGSYIEKMPAAIADPLFGTGDATPDVWLYKGTVFEA